MKQKALTALPLFFLSLGAILLSLPVAHAQDSEITDTVSDTTITEEIDYSGMSLVYTMVIDGVIGAVTDSRVEDAIALADENSAELLVIILDTPGGYMEATWAICKSLLNSPVPVCVYIAPSGARAGSAGVYMSYAAHIAAMAPSTNIGAAHPVSGSGEKIDSVMNDKITNDAVAQIKAAAEKRGRNVEWAEDAVRKSVSITNSEALELNVVNLVAENLDDLLAQLDGREVDLPEGSKVLALKSVRTEEIKTTFAQRVLQVLTSPQIVLFLFSIGGLGIVLELYNPGAIFPGVVGAISLILALYASQALPINYAGVALIMLAIVMFIAEVKIASAGLLTVGGLIALFLGGLMLIDTPDPNLRVPIDLLITVVVFVGIIVGLAMWVVLKAARRKPFTGDEGMLGMLAEVRRGGMVYVNGALWKADGITDMEPGDKVEIVAIDSMTLKVKRLET